MFWFISNWHKMFSKYTFLHLIKTVHAFAPVLTLRTRFGPPVNVCLKLQPTAWVFTNCRSDSVQSGVMRLQLCLDQPWAVDLFSRGTSGWKPSLTKHQTGFLQYAETNPTWTQNDDRKQSHTGPLQTDTEWRVISFAYNFGAVCNVANFRFSWEDMHF